MALVGDMVVQTANAPGTGTFNLIAAPAGRSSFASQCGAGQVFYFASDSASWEKGVGTITVGSPDTLSRDTVLGNSLGSIARVNFAGQVSIECSVPAERDIWANAGGDAWLMAARRLSNVGAGTALTDGAQLWQVGAVRGQTIQPTSGVFVVPLPPLIPGDGVQVFQVDMTWLTTSADAAYYVRFSVDGGATYLSGSSDYYYSLSTLNGAQLSGFPFVGAFGQLTPVYNASFPMRGRLNFHPHTRQWEADVSGAIAGNNVRSLSCGNLNNGATPTHLVIGAVSQNVTGGFVRLTRMGF